MTAWAWGLPVLTPRTPRLLSPVPQPPRCLQSASSQLPQALVQGTPNQVNSAWTQSRDENRSPRPGQNRTALPVGVVVGGAVPQAACRTHGRAGAVQPVGPGLPGLLPPAIWSDEHTVQSHLQTPPGPSVGRRCGMACLEARAGWVARQLRPANPWTCLEFTGPAQNGTQPLCEGCIRRTGGPMCRLSPGCDPQPTTQQGPQDYLCSSPFPPEVAYLALNPYGSGRQGAGPPKC